MRLFSDAGHACFHGLLPPITAVQNAPEIIILPG
jgi:hypothetical protein